MSRTQPSDRLKTIGVIGAKLLGAFIVFILIAAPANQMPEQISGAQPEWDHSTQSFEIRLNARFGVATAVEHGNFEIWTQLELFEPGGNPLATVQHQTPATIGTDNPSRDRNAVPLSPLPVPWDRNGGSYSGEVFVRGISALVSESNRIIFATQYEELVEVGP